MRVQLVLEPVEPLRHIGLVVDPERLVYLAESGVVPRRVELLLG